MSNNVTFMRPDGKRFILESGLILDGALGWHNVYRVVDLAVSLGMPLDADDARTMERFAAGDADFHDEDQAPLWIAEEAEEWLNANVADAYFTWYEGDFILEKKDLDTNA
jgi:hypothetical protein